MKPDTNSATLGPTLEERLATLSQEERAKLEETVAAFLSEISRIGERTGRYQKDLLRRLGVRENLDDFEERWLQTWAAAQYVGISSESFGKMTPREIFAVLEHRARDLELAGAKIGTLRPQPGVSTAEQTAALEASKRAESAHEQPAKLRGPKPNHEGAARVAAIVATIAPDGKWRPKLDDVCDALDQAQEPCPSKWFSRYNAECWKDYPERSIAVKAIQGRLDLTKQKPKLARETLS